MYEGRNFAVFHSIVDVFPRIMALSIGSVSLQACYHKSFPPNWKVCTLTAKVFPLENFTVYSIYIFSNIMYY